MLRSPTVVEPAGREAWSFEPSDQQLRPPRLPRQCGVARTDTVRLRIAGGAEAPKGLKIFLSFVLFCITQSLFETMYGIFAHRCLAVDGSTRLLRWDEHKLFVCRSRDQ